ncbi:MAG: hypothetical protein M9900_15605 [Flavobacteriales bacterium]|nr:hypothetical protein [Flavobacteriales bacterium]
MFRAVLAVLFVWAALAGRLSAQGTAGMTGWEPLPDSLMRAWQLSGDQMRRVQVIEEDYGLEREELWNTPGLNGQDLEDRMARLGEARKAEIEGVLGATTCAKWVKWLRETRNQRGPGQ